MVDGYLLATFLLIFGMGLYELSVNKIEDAEGTQVASSVLGVHSLDDLKGRFAIVVLMILIVRYFEYALGMGFDTALDLFYFSMGIAFLGVALWVVHLADKSH